MINITKEQINAAIPKVKDGLDKYYNIQNNFNNINIEQDRNFQTKFNGFYKVRRNYEWRKIYYEIFESSRNFQNIDFEIILKSIYKKTNRIEASFTSKLIATINPNLPVLDKFVLENAGLTLPYQGANDRINIIINIYTELINKFYTFRKTENGKYLVSKFKEKYPNYKITETKMIDLVLWQTR